MICKTRHQHLTATSVAGIFQCKDCGWVTDYARFVADRDGDAPESILHATKHDDGQAVLTYTVERIRELEKQLERATLDHIELSNEYRLLEEKFRELQGKSASVQVVINVQGDAPTGWLQKVFAVLDKKIAEAVQSK